MGNKTINTNTLFDKVCTCGMKYEDCTLDTHHCQEFLRHKKEAQEKFEIRFQKLLSNGKGIVQ